MSAAEDATRALRYEAIARPATGAGKDNCQFFASVLNKCSYLVCVWCMPDDVQTHSTDRREVSWHVLAEQDAQMVNEVQIEFGINVQASTESLETSILFGDLCSCGVLRI